MSMLLFTVNNYDASSTEIHTAMSQNPCTGKNSHYLLCQAEENALFKSVNLKEADERSTRSSKIIL